MAGDTSTGAAKFGPLLAGSGVAVAAAVTGRKVGLGVCVGGRVGVAVGVGVLVTVGDAAGVSVAPGVPDVSPL